MGIETRAEGRITLHNSPFFQHRIDLCKRKSLFPGFLGSTTGTGVADRGGLEINFKERPSEMVLMTQ
jgi:hypothetical protein